ncbi:MAG: MFS transporter [Sphaerochaetaceae bacterium]
MSDTSMTRPSVAGLSLYRGLERNIYTLFVIRIINRFGDFVQLLLVLILTGKLNLTPAQAGFFVSLSVVATMLGQFASGYLADRWGRKVPLVVCQVMVSFSYLACAVLFEPFPQLVPYLILISSPFRGGTSPLTNTMVADFSRPDHLSKSFSLLYLGTNIGVALGPVAASFLYVRSIVLLFSFSSLLLFLSTLLLIVAIPKAGATDKRVSSHSSKTFRMPRILLLFFFLFSLYSFAYTQNTFTLPLQFTSLYGDVLGSSRYAMLMTINAVTVLIATAFLTTWTHKLGQFGSMALAMLFFVIGYGIYAKCREFPLFLVATCIWTFGEILMATNANVFVNAYAPPPLRSRCNAFLTIASSLGRSIAPSAGGLLLAMRGYEQLWSICAGLCFLLGCSYIVLDRYLKR